MGQFGEQLRKEREARGVALETISARTKVVARYLNALEHDDFALLPGGILSKGIVREYARTVGLDEKDWVERFLAASREQGHAAGEKDWVEFVSNVGQSRPRMGGHSHRRLGWTGVGLLLLLLAFAGWWIWSEVTGRALAEKVQHPAVTSAAVATTPDGATQ